MTVIFFPQPLPVPLLPGIVRYIPPMATVSANKKRKPSHRTHRTHRTGSSTRSSSAVQGGIRSGQYRTAWGVTKRGNGLARELGPLMFGRRAASKGWR